MPDSFSLTQDASLKSLSAEKYKDFQETLEAFLKVRELVLTETKPAGFTPQGDAIQEGNTSILNGMGCQVQVLIQKEGKWVMACIKPRDTDWTFGKCYPQMQGMPATPAGITPAPAKAPETFLLSHLGMSNPLWIFIGLTGEGSAVPGQMADHLKQLSFWNEWQEKEKDALLTKLGDAFGKQNSFYHWGNFPQLPEAIADLGDILPKILTQGLWQGEVYRPVLSLAEQRKNGQVTTFVPNFPVLRLELPLGSTDHLFGADVQGELGLVFSAPLYFCPGNSFIGLKGDVKIDIGDTNQLELSLELDYPLDGDIIKAIGKLKDSSKIPFADPPLFPNGSMPAAQSLDLDLILLFSKASRKLKSVEFDVEMKDWELFDNKLKLEDLRFSFLVYEPTGMKAVMASIDATALIGAAPDQIEFSCGGAYPSGQLYLEIRSGAKLAKVFNGLGIPVSDHDPGMLDLLIRDMRVEYNVRSGQFYAGIDLEGPLTIHWFTLKDFQFHITKGSADWSLGISAAIGLGDIPLELSASFGSQGQWAFFARAFDIPLGKVLPALKKEFHSDISLPDQIKDLMVNTLSLSFNKGGNASDSNLDFLFTCEAKYPQDGGKADLTLTIHFSTENIASGNPNAKPLQGSAVPTWSKGRTMNFSVEAILKIDGKSFLVDLEMAKGAQPGSSTDVLIAQSNDKVAFDLKSFLQLVSGDHSLADSAPSVEVVIDNLILAYVKSVDQQGNHVSKYLFGINLDLDLQLSHLPVAGKAFSGNEGIKNLQFIFATQHLTQAEVQTINADLAKLLIPALPEASSPGAASSPPANAAGASPVAFSKGLHVGATLNLGSYTKVFAFATGGGAPANVGNPALGSTPGATPQGGNAASPSGAPGTGMIARRPSTAAGTWIDIQQTIGPFTLERVGANYQDKMFWFMLSASFSSAGLTVGLDGLGIGAPIEGFSPENVRAKLSGMSLTYQGGPIEISGGFLEIQMPPDKNDPNDKPRVGYAGEALIKADPFSLSAMGLYTTVYSAAQQKTEDSLFIFAMLDLPLGGPPPFFVTGLAGGFGYNSELNLPPIGQLNQYLLVQGALPPPQGSSNPLGGMSNNPGSVLDKLMAQSQGGRADVEPMAGEDWLGVGVRFTSFEMIKSFALLTVSFGSRFEIALLGRSQIAVPTNVDKPIAFAEVDLEAVFIPDATGNTPILAVDAKLAYGSFIFDTSCRLVGGFAFYIWSSGDFVVTFGGYHPYFDVPALYPREERVGFVWQLSSVLLIKGGIYFALTPSALMAGGGLSAVFQAGPIKAWFNAQADFLISWKPFHYEILIAIQLGVSADLGLFSINIHLGVGLQLWGPPFGGVATVDLSIISFSIHFGAAVALPPRLNWDEFSTSFLPDEGSIFSGKISKGLLKTVDEYGWVVDPSHFEIATNSSVPFTQALSGSNAPPGEAFLVNSWTTQLGILPMGVKQLKSTHYLDIKKKSEENADYVEYDGANRLAFEPILADAPKAVWSPLGLDDPTALQTSRLEKETMIGQAMVGIRIRPGVMHPDQTKSVLVKNLLFEDDLPPVGCTGFYSSPVSSSVQAASNAPAWGSIDQALLDSLKAEGFALPESA